jgi:hypothetical protein
MFRIRRLAWFLMVGMLGACSSRPATVTLRGDVTYDGRAIERGTIDFVPIEGTPGASVKADIAGGRYEISDKKWGVRPNGVYQVRISAFWKAGEKQPGRTVPGQPAEQLELEEEFLPPIYNSQSTLTVRVADLPDKNKTDFRLKVPVR